MRDRERLAENGPRDNVYGGLQVDNEFWRFSLAVYQQGAVANECLALQEALGLDVNILLFSAWLGRRGIILHRIDIEAASRAVASWHESVVRSLRNVRQQMKTFGTDFEDLRARIKAIEIEAEQIEQAILFACAQGIDSSREGADRSDAIAHNVSEYIAMKSGPASPEDRQAAPSLIHAAGRLAS